MPMFYLPGVLKSLDAHWLARSIEPAIRAIHASGRLDLIDAHFGYPEGAGCVQAGRRLGIPVFITVRGFETEYLQVPRVAARMLAALQAAAGCICVSHSLKALIVGAGVPEDRVQVIHNAIARDVFRPGDREAARRALGIDPGIPLVVTIGHLVSRKRHHVLIDAFARVLEARPEALLAIIGARSFERTYPDRLTEMAARLWPAGAVRFVGNVSQSQVVQWLDAADAFALGSAREGCCNAVLEALASGVPVVTTPAGDNASFVHDGVNGRIVPIDDVAALAQGITDVLERRDWDRQRISEGLAVGGWDRVGREVVEFFAARLGVA